MLHLRSTPLDATSTISDDGEMILGGGMSASIPKPSLPMAYAFMPTKAIAKRITGIIEFLRMVILYRTILWREILLLYGLPGI